MSLHRAEASDWGKLPAGERTAWQRLAARTGGIITPGNLVSVLGGLLVVYGLYLIMNHSLAAGTAALALGRLADILDGYIAELTKTKSPLGEAVDATIDKIVIWLCLIVLVAFDLLPLIVGLIMAAHALFNILTFAIASHRKLRLHPSARGKLAAAAEWTAVGLYLVAALTENHSQLATDAALVAAVLSFGIFVALAGSSSLDYSRQLRQKAGR